MVHPKTGYFLLKRPHLPKIVKLDHLCDCFLCFFADLLFELFNMFLFFVFDAK